MASLFGNVHAHGDGADNNNIGQKSNPTPRPGGDQPAGQVGNAGLFGNGVGPAPAVAPAAAKPADTSGADGGGNKIYRRKTRRKRKPRRKRKTRRKGKTRRKRKTRNRK